MRAAMTAVLLVSASGAKRKRELRVGYFIYGANLRNLPVSQDERIRGAFEHAMESFPCDEWEHVYFVSGKTVEAHYMKAELLELYAGQPGQYQPTIHLEAEAIFTVDNVLKTLTIINKEELDRLCLVSSDYHFQRAARCYEKFSEANLCLYPKFERVEVPHQPATLIENPLVSKKYSNVASFKAEASKAKGNLGTCDEVFLNGAIISPKQCLCGECHRTRRDEIACPARDGLNASIFAQYIKLMKDGGFKSLGQYALSKLPRIQEYLSNNNKLKREEKVKALGMFTRFVDRFVKDSRWSCSASAEEPEALVAPQMKKQKTIRF